MEDENIYIVLIIVCLLVIGCIYYLYSLKPSTNKQIDIIDKPLKKDYFQYSLMVHLENDKLSEERIQKVKKIYKKYEIPIHLMKATHWKHDLKEIQTYPINENLTYGRTGAYGLAGSFYKCIKKAYDEKWPYLLFFEDDAVPILPKKKFHHRLNGVLTTLPDNGDGIYFLSLGVWCHTHRNEPITWKKFNEIQTYVSGAHSVYFGKKSIQTIFRDIQQYTLDQPIDEWLKKYDPWVWWGDLSENGMFRGLYKQLGMHCNNIFTLPGPINNS